MDEALLEIQDRTFRDEIVVLDDTSFTKCFFERCDLRYHGGPVTFRETHMDGCSWSFGGPAQRAISLIQCFGLDTRQVCVPGSLLPS